MPVRRLPVRPDLDQLKHQAKDLLRAIHAGDPAAIAELREQHPDPLDPASAKLADAQLVLARSYQASSWTRLVQAVQLVDAIWRDDLETVRALVTANPHLIHEQALIREDSNWGPPMTYAANVGRDRIIRMLREHGRHRHRDGARPRRSSREDRHSQNAARDGRESAATRRRARRTGLHAQRDRNRAGAESRRAAYLTTSGRRLAPVDVVLETDARNPAAKHAILEMYARHGLEIP